MWIGDDISGTRYDAAKSIISPSARMPTKAELTELKNNCKMYIINYQGQEGVAVVGSNGNAIFIPSDGYVTSNEYSQKTTYDLYVYKDGINLWGSTLKEGTTDYRSAWALTIQSWGNNTVKCNVEMWPRFWGFRIRPVSDR
ncbi:MAG: hypothetical protein IJV10_01970 [Prevotella sp.]|nr:hypothetical protein [Prevotella sp.]